MSKFVSSVVSDALEGRQVVKSPILTRLLLLFVVFMSNVAYAESAFVAFESAHVRPIALDESRSLLFAVNTPDSRLAIYDVSESKSMKLLAEVPVGLEPVSVALRDTELGMEAWVVNHLSDSVSVVGVDLNSPELSVVTRTLYVGDEPRDIVFAGSEQSRAFITTAHRGQNRPGDPQLLAEGVPRADVWVFDANQPGDDLGGNPLTILELFGDTPRALAASPDGSKVYAAVFASGSGTTTIPQPVVSENGGLPPAPSGATEGAPEVGLIVKYKDGQWLDEIGRDWSEFVPFSLPDYDVFEIDANAPVPVELRRISGVGTVLFNMAVRPDTGALYVSNTEAFNEQRFEPVLNGRFIENRISVVKNGAVNAVDLNPHINFNQPAGSLSEIQESLASPGDLLFSSDGQTLYVTAFSSGKVAIFDTATLEEGDSGQRTLIEVGEGPSGIALDEQRSRLYVMNRLDHSISIVDTKQNKEISEFVLPYNPEPESVVEGRKFLYDARLTSGRGNVSCHSCHLFGDMDQLAWDLGNPFGEITENPNIRNPAATSLLGGIGGLIGPGGSTPTPFHPMKGPMTTQSLRGMADAGPMHWRGDKTGGLTLDGEVDPEGDSLDENAAFLRFNSAFVGLQDRSKELSENEMQAFADFMLQVRYPPNPIKSLDNNDTPAEANGRDLFIDNELVPIEDNQSCASCHVLPLTTNGTIARTAQIDSEQADFKIAHLRNIYQKVGMFGAAAGAIVGTRETLVGDQIRGFGLTHDGSISDVITFIQHPQNIVVPLPTRNGISADEKRRNIAAFILAGDTGLAPIIGQQLTISSSTSSQPAYLERLQLMLAQADQANADIVVKGVWDERSRGAVYQGDGVFLSDKTADPLMSTDELLRLAGPLTFTAFPIGDGKRAGIDRDLDGVLDSDEKRGGRKGGAMPLSLVMLLVALMWLRGGLRLSNPRR